jgi:heptose-I-phosphate ethanolaminephosphotransferase
MNEYFKHSGSVTLWVLMYPLLVFVVLAEEFRESELTARLGWLILLIGVSYVFRSRLFFVSLLIPFALSGVVDLFYTTTFNQQFESHLVRVLTDTDSQESLEFISVYFSWTNLAIVLVYLLGLVYLGRQLELFRPMGWRAKITVFLGGLMLLVATQQLLFHERFKDVLPGALGQMADGLQKYFAVQHELAQRPKLLAAFDEPVGLEKAETAQTYVVVIGESAARGHHGLYGYGRDTNPQLGAIRDELIVLDDVIAPFAVTYLSLSHTLTEKSLQNDKPFAESLSLVGLAKKAGFKTWWISNQPRYEGTTLSLSLVADEVRYVTDDGKTDSHLLPAVGDALADAARHKVIFVHLRGSHMTYDKRYPPEFDYFKDAQGVAIYTEQPSAQQVAVVNAYDNSIRYTDFVVRGIIDRLKQSVGSQKAGGASPAAAGLVYFADHGEEVYDYKDFIGHELKRVSAPMFEIPFVVWTNEGYQQVFADKVERLRQQRTQAFLNDDFFDFGLCFMGIQTSLAKAASSPCEAGYQPKPRVVAGKRYENGQLH